ncbi:hypothetical protein [Palleronia abyssalis]|uniref:Uncharacterized protein n=1 Tax=Palleronia abyssalis TaxID=1501240 RepID=A0A2R8BVS4_9RHOB|nr:hypothetical protein [Palleronia abyssalis]SPJ24261.1 hypothetical protein PAA8504_02089 [Palleronia abyssalis]
MSNGIATIDLAKAAQLDELLGNCEGSTVRASMDQVAAAIGSRLGATYETLQELDADLDWPEGTIGTVWNDGVEPQNGAYKKSGDIGAGQWARVGDAPIGVAMKHALDRVTEARAEADRSAAQVPLAQAQAGIADAHRLASAGHAAEAGVSRDQAAAAGLVAGNRIFTGTLEEAETATADGETFLFQNGPGTAIYRNDLGSATFVDWIGEVLFDSAQTLLAFTGEMNPGTLVRTREEGFAYRVVADWTSAWGAVSAGGVKLYPISSGGWITARMFGAMEGVDVTAAVQAAINFAMYGGPGYTALVGARGAQVDVSEAKQSDPSLYYLIYTKFFAQ